VETIPAHVCDALKLNDAACLFVVCRPTNATTITATSIGAYFKTFKPSPTVPAVVSKAQLAKVLATVEMYYCVTITPVEKAGEENNFIARLIGDDRSTVREVFELPEEHAGMLKCECTSPMFYQSGVISVEIAMVLVHLGLVNVEVLIASITNRRRLGRPNTKSSWEKRDGATTSRDAVWYLHDLQKNKPGKYYQWRVLIKRDGRSIIGVVGAPQKKDRSREWHWQVDFPDSPGMPSEDLSGAELAEALHQASEAGFLGPAK
jgi:hypothetical protein